ncbi:hypothetical protein ACIQU4_27900 [Streptomyces sp. NPDC090741]|uniref:hypothetical protein n=1 Tax=Streptomyces sp. NPDC090741 TaxID=3365967 RepID=UPI00382FAA3B
MIKFIGGPLDGERELHFSVAEAPVNIDGRTAGRYVRRSAEGDAPGVYEWVPEPTAQQEAGGTPA